MTDPIWLIQKEQIQSFPVLEPLDVLKKARQEIQKQKEKDREEKEKGKKKSKWTTSLDQTFEIDFAQAQPIDSIGSIDWNKEEMVGVERSVGGSEVFLFNFSILKYRDFSSSRQNEELSLQKGLQI